MRKNIHATSKTSHHTIPSKKATKEVRSQEIAFLRSPWLQEYLDPEYLRITPTSEKIIDIIAQELLDWSSSDEHFTVNSFLVKKRIHWKTFGEWKKKFPKLKWASDIAMMALADRREVFGLLRKIDPTTAFNGLAKYDEEWKDFLQWKSILNDKNASQPDVTIQLSNITSENLEYLKYKEEFKRWLERKKEE